MDARPLVGAATAGAGDYDQPTAKKAAAGVRSHGKSWNWWMSTDVVPVTSTWCSRAPGAFKNRSLSVLHGRRSPRRACL